ncbi:MAG: aldo/keto reductase [Sphingobacteriales bacterium]|nr:MAG: aldo/keto reductase [Sphingobacteriales bacterium]
MAARRKLANTGIEISPIMFGGNVFGWTLNEQESFSILDAFADSGFNFIDTADVYSKWATGNQGGESETIIGNWLKKRGDRSKFVIATKVGAELNEQKKGLSARYIKQAVEDSLTRLQTDYIDLYQSHYDDPNTPVAETMSAYNDLIKEGKVRHIGTSNMSAARIMESNKFAKDNSLSAYISLQPLYNLYDREKFETEYLALITEQKMAVIPYYSLASGFLTGKYRSESDLGKSPRGGGAKKYLNEKGFRILQALDSVAQQHNVPAAQIAIAWLLHKPFITAPIASATSEKQLQDLLAATQINLTKEQIETLDNSGETRH